VGRQGVEQRIRRESALSSRDPFRSGGVSLVVEEKMSIEIGAGRVEPDR